jgi:hypothetical protein
MATDEAATRRRAHRPGDPIDEAAIREQHAAILRTLKKIRATREKILAERGGKPFTVEEVQQALDEVRGHGN